MIDDEDDTHFCIKCHATILGLDNYVIHRKSGCTKNLEEPIKSPLPSHIVPQDETFSLKADDFFSSLELQSSSKKAPGPSTSGKSFSGILTRSKTSAAIQAASKSQLPEIQAPKEGKTGWLEARTLTPIDVPSKIVKNVDNLERTKREETPSIRPYEESEDESEEYDYEEDSDEEDNHGPPRSFTGGKWKPVSPLHWTPPHSSNNDRDWNTPPPNHTKGKWKPSSPISSAKEHFNVPPPSFTGSKWTQSKTMGRSEYSEIPPPSHTKGKWKPGERQEVEDEDYPPPEHTKGKWKPGSMPERNSEHSKTYFEEDKSKTSPEESTSFFPPPTHTKGKWSLGFQPADKCSQPDPSYTKGKWKPFNVAEDKSLEVSPPPKIQSRLPSAFSKGKWQPSTEKLTKSVPISRRFEESPLRKSSGSVQYWCGPCNRRLASKIVYERHLKSELHFKRTSQDGDFDDSAQIALHVPKERRKSLKKQTEDAEQPESKRKRNRKKLFIKCEVCRSKVNSNLVGKHLISHYHCRKSNLSQPQSQQMVLDNIRDIVLQSPFQCNACKFYCNTYNDFLIHWRSSTHLETISLSTGLFLCSFCYYQCEDNEDMFNHITCEAHKEVVAVINRSVPIIIRRIRPVKCNSCAAQFILNMELKQHCKEYNHDYPKYLGNEYYCKTCLKYFKGPVSFARHLRKRHKRNVYTCSLCNLTFSTAMEAQKHRSSKEHRYAVLEREGKASSGKGGLKQCQYCKEVFESIPDWKAHLEEAHPEHKAKCPHCGKCFVVPQELTVHLRTKACTFSNSPNVSHMSCNTCPFSTESSSELLFHKVLHTEPIVVYPTADEGHSSKKRPVQKYKCPICQKMFSKDSLKCHLRIHTKERPFVCDLCNRAFVRRNNWVLHMKKHENVANEKATNESGGDKPFLCSTCGASFKKRFILQQHMAVHLGKSCKCPMHGCIYTARSMGQLNEHFLTHSDSKSYSCGLCEYKGKTRQQLMRHQTVHNETRKFKCPLCPFTARLSGHFKRHMRTHTGAKPFACPHCKYRCNTLENIRKHVLSTNKHPGKSVYECKFCAEKGDHFGANFAKEFRKHLMETHRDTFETGTAAASYVTGIYEARYDASVLVFEEVEEPNETSQDEPDSFRKLAVDPGVDTSAELLSAEAKAETATAQEELFPMFVVARDEIIGMVDGADSWGTVDSYDVEEGVLVPFHGDGEVLFQENFE